MDRPEVRYVAVGDADVAYQILGDGPLDLLFCYGLGSHIEFNWHVPVIAEFLDRLASLFRLIIFDRRGTGASDGVPRNAVPTLEDWTEDMAAVLDAAGSERTAILATIDTGPIAILYTAMHPERISALVLLNTAARFIEAEDYPIGFPPTRSTHSWRWLRQDGGRQRFLRPPTRVPIGSSCISLRRCSGPQPRLEPPRPSTTPSCETMSARRCRSSGCRPWSST